MAADVRRSVCRHPRGDRDENGPIELEGPICPVAAVHPLRVRRTTEVEVDELEATIGIQRDGALSPGEGKRPAACRAGRTGCVVASRPAREDETPRVNPRGKRTCLYHHSAYRG